MYHVSAQGVNERMINVHYYYLKFLCWPLLRVRFRHGITVTPDYGAKNQSILGVKYLYPARGKSGQMFPLEKRKKKRKKEKEEAPNVETLN